MIPQSLITADMISNEPEDRTAIKHHFYLKQFFEGDDAKELRFSSQFEQLYRIMEEYDQTENPAALGWAFETLREYHRIMREENLDESITLPDGTPGVEIHGQTEAANLARRSRILRRMHWRRSSRPC